MAWNPPVCTLSAMPGWAWLNAWMSGARMSLPMSVATPTRRPPWLPERTSAMISAIERARDTSASMTGSTCAPMAVGRLPLPARSNSLKPSCSSSSARVFETADSLTFARRATSLAVGASRRARAICRWRSLIRDASASTVFGLTIFSTEL